MGPERPRIQAYTSARLTGRRFGSRARLSAMERLRSELEQLPRPRVLNAGN